MPELQQIIAMACDGATLDDVLAAGYDEEMVDLALAPGASWDGESWDEDQLARKVHLYCSYRA